MKKTRYRAFFNLVWLARAAVLVLLLAVAFVLDNAATQNYRSDVRQEWQARLNDMSLKLQGTVLQNVQTVWGLAANVSVQPDITEAEFQQLASVIFALAPQLRNIGLAPDLTIRNIYPLEGNEAALGLDLTRQSLSTEQVQRLKESRKALFSGPINLVQGGQGMAARIPIFENESGRFWGVISVILDLNRLYTAVDMQSFSENGHLALFRTSARGEDPFFRRCQNTMARSGSYRTQHPRHYMDAVRPTQRRVAKPSGITGAREIRFKSDGFIAFRRCLLVNQPSAARPPDAAALFGPV